MVKEMGILRDLWHFLLSMGHIFMPIIVAFGAPVWFTIGWFASHGNFILSVIYGGGWVLLTGGGLIVYADWDEKRREGILEKGEVQVTTDKQEAAIEWLVKDRLNPKRKKWWQRL